MNKADSASSCTQNRPNGMAQGSSVDNTSPPRRTVNAGTSASMAAATGPAAPATLAAVGRDRSRNAATPESSSRSRASIRMVIVGTGYSGG